MSSGKSAFTLVEMLVVIVIIGTAISIFYSTLFLYWPAFDEFVTRINLWEESDKIIEIISPEVRALHDITIENEKKVTLSDKDNTTIAAYIIDASGAFIVRKSGSGDVVLSNSLDLNGSSFGENIEGSSGKKTLVVNLALSEQGLRRRVRIATSTEIMPRN